MKNTLLPVAFVLATSAYAGDLPNFTDIDTNSNGILSIDEFSVIEGFDFTAIDADGDGTITLDEYVAAGC